MLTLAVACAYEENVKKSRFAAYAAPVATTDDAMAFFAERGDPTATHNCWAYRIGQQYRFNDDGEPGGTAGRPILQAIDGQGMDRVAVLVVRWFGGIKLGAGGLVRAYGGVAANCLRAGEAVEIVETARVRCTVAFSEQTRVRARLTQAGVAFLSECYGVDGVQWRIEIPRAALQDIETLYTDLTRGQGMWLPELAQTP